jgi:hypothetical protein
MTKAVEGSGRGLTVRYYLGTCLEGLRKPTKILPVYGPRFESRISRIRSRSVDHSSRRSLLAVWYNLFTRIHVLHRCFKTLLPWAAHYPKTAEYSEVCCVVRWLYAIKRGKCFWVDPVLAYTYNIRLHNNMTTGLGTRQSWLIWRCDDVLSSTTAVLLSVAKQIVTDVSEVLAASIIRVIVQDDGGSNSETSVVWLHGATSQKTTNFMLVALRTWTLAYLNVLLVIRL